MKDPIINPEHHSHGSCMEYEQGIIDLMVLVETFPEFWKDDIITVEGKKYVSLLSLSQLAKDMIK